MRVVNVVDLMRLQPDTVHPHGMSDAEFDALFTTDRPVIFAYHGYPALIHRLTYRRTNHRNIHVRGYNEEGTTTTPFDMVMLNDLDRFHLVMDVIDRRARPRPAVATSGRTWPTPGCAAASGRATTARIPGDHRLDVAVLTGGRILVVNAGSTSLKLRVVSENGQAQMSTRSRRPARRARRGRASDRPRRVALRDPVLVDEAVRRRMIELEELAPLHNAPALAALDDARARFPDLPHVAVFDTGFHATIPPEAAIYAVPRAWREEWGVRRFGFHGLSVAWSAQRAAELPPAVPASAGGVSSGRRLVGDGGRGRTLGGHHHGLHAARGRTDDHALRLGRSGGGAARPSE